jgi:hypothetical protein
MVHLRAIGVAAGFVILSAIFVAPSPARYALAQRAGAHAATSPVSAAVARLAARKPQASEVQTYPERPTPSQPAIPNSPPTEKTPPQPPKTEQYTLSNERYEKAIAFSRAEYVLYFVSYLLGVFVLIVVLRFGIAAKLRSFAERKTSNHWLQ